MRTVLAFSMLMITAACGPNVPAVETDGGDPGGPCSNEGQTRCTGQLFETCTGGQWIGTTCSYPDTCSDELGCVECDPDAFSRVCVGDNVHECNADGTIGPLVQMCPIEACANGGCIDACGAAASNRSYLGCEFYPVDLDNAIEVLGPDDFGFGCDFLAPGSVLEATMVCWSAGSGVASGLCDYGNDCSTSPGTTCSTQSVCVLNAQKSPFAVVVSNPDPVNAVSVTLANASGQTQTMSVAGGSVQALFPQMLGFPDASLDHSGLDSKAYKLTSTAPIVAYQFNPLNNVNVFSNDGSLLLPAHTYDLEYYAVTYPTLTRRPQTNDYNGYVTVVASMNGTMVSVTPTAAVRAGAGVSAIAAGSTQMFSLNQFQTLNLEAVAGGDLTGTYITSNNPIGVYGGHEATVINPSTPECCADHLEDQLFPASTWGKVYAVPKSANRATQRADLIRVMAQKPGTTVTFTPAQGSCGTLNPGQFCDVFINADVEVSANEPILVAHFLSSNGGIDPDSGDPAISFVPPSEQFRLSYTLLVPQQYNSNFFSIVAPATASVMLDGADVTGQLATFGTGAYKAGRIPVTAGQHKLECPDGCGVEGYGWSEAVSYLYAGGLDLKQIVVE